MTQTRYRFVGDQIAFEFAVTTDGAATPLPAAVLACAMIQPDGQVIAGTAAWLAAPDDHVVRCTIPDGATNLTGLHDMQLRITDASLAEPKRGRVFVELLASAV